jgi:ATP-dependent DNA helicase PIF1
MNDSSQFILSEKKKYTEIDGGTSAYDYNMIMKGGKEGLKDFLMTHKIKLDKKQFLALRKIIRGKNIFLTGAAGTGKSYLTNILPKIFNVIERKHVITAMTGVAAVLINGTTFHSWSGFAILKDYEQIINKIESTPRYKLAWKKIETIVIDEISMMSSEMLDNIDRVAKKIRNNDKPFGGIQMVFIGDLYQLLVFGRAELIIRHKLFRKIETIELTKIYRQSDKKFCKCLNRIRKGIYKKKDIRMIRGREDIEVGNEKIKPTILYPLNKDVDRVNKAELKKCSESTGNEIITCKSIYSYFSINQILLEREKYGLAEENEMKGIDEMDGISAENDTEEFDAYYDNIEIKERDLIRYIEKHRESAIDNPKKVSKSTKEMYRKILDKGISDNIYFCVGAQVMLKMNIDIKKQLINGSRGVVVGTSEGLPIVEFLNGKIMKIKRFLWHHTDVKNKLIVVKEQIPLKLAYAVSIHSSQGSSLDSVSIDFNNIFAYGMAYVALSRARSLESISIRGFDEDKIMVNEEITDFFSQKEEQKEGAQ